MQHLYTSDLSKYQRRKSIEVHVGNIAIGGDNPIRVQSMTTVDTMDTKGSIEECIRMIESGCELIRITAPSLKEAKNLAHIKEGLRTLGFKTPLVADIHFTPNAAEAAARIVEKVRINPGNYVDKKKFDTLDYTDDEYAQEIERIKERFTPLVNICKEHGTALRIGTNHGSLSDRIMSRYGDTPHGMVESAMEFLRICDELDFHEVIISMKSSNPLVMVQAYRMLVAQLEKENLKPYPLHLGVTEAGEGEDGRIKSALGIGTLLEDGIGDTIRVSLTEAPEFESPVARKLVAKLSNREPHKTVKLPQTLPYSPFEYHRRESKEVNNIGGKHVPVVIADLWEEEINKDSLSNIGYHYIPATDKWITSDTAADFALNQSIDPHFDLPGNLKILCDRETWEEKSFNKRILPVIQVHELDDYPEADIVFLSVKAKDLNIDLQKKIEQHDNLVLILHSQNDFTLMELRAAIISLNIDTPVVFSHYYPQTDEEQVQLYAATDLGGVFLDGFGDGIAISGEQGIQTLNSLAFGVLQAARTRITKTEYISCPSCGRTLFDLQETTAMIREKTSHLKGLKIGVMGCIVNGPGEMADADYGYVGSGVDKITLYRGQEVVQKGINGEQALTELIELIKADGNWVEP